ncbi:trace amine-associated receptor 13c-like [Archocentrus centrarchus]|uniref:trace amine-associated receptor 13c-like n=1 Tax=Archocentrus centrarchus TaxID=63155 RepID=UPI0011EA5115|nr:trace amine-associated receptor 13c-like [Archocentrus centrarchus]
MEETELCFPQLLNSSCTRQKRPQIEAVFIYTPLSFISLLTAVLNLLVIISVAHFKQLHTPANLLLLSLAVSDFFVALIMSCQISLLDGCWFLGDHMCALYCTLDYIATSASVGTMVLISADRYVAICDPLRYPTKITLRRVSVCICVCWGSSILYNSLIMKDNFKQPGRYNSCYGECVVVIDYFVGIVDFILTFVGPVTVIIFLYLRVFVVAVSQARAMRSRITAVRIQGSETVHAKKSEIKAAKTLGVLVISFLICLFPFFCSSMVGQNSFFDIRSVPLERLLFYFNSCLNPLIYTFCYPWFRKSVKLIVTFKIFRHGSSEASIL